MPKKKKEYPGWRLNDWRGEWICSHGVGHYDPRLVKNGVHGCDGCCRLNTFPPFVDGYYNKKDKEE